MTGIALIPDLGVFVGRGGSVYAGDGVAAAVTGSLTMGCTVDTCVGLTGAGVVAGPVYPDVVPVLPVFTQYAVAAWG